MKTLKCFFTAIVLLAAAACGNKSGSNSDASANSSDSNKVQNEKTDATEQNKNNEPNAGKAIEKFVTSNDGLLMRDKPDVSGKVLTVIPYNMKVIILEERIKKDNILKIDGFWVKAKYGNFTGFCFDGFLK